MLARFLEPPRHVDCFFDNLSVQITYAVELLFKDSQSASGLLSKAEEFLLVHATIGV